MKRTFSCPQGGDMVAPGRLSLSVFCAVSLAARAAAGAVIADRHVTVEFDPVDRYRAELVPEAVSYATTELREKLGLAVPRRVTVRLLRRKEAFTGISGGRPVELYAGRAYPATGAVHVNMAAIGREAFGDAYVRTIRHELVHLAVAYSLGRYADLPTWFEEGLACRFGSPFLRSDAEVLHRGTAVALESLDEFPREKEALSLAYAQSDAVVRFLVRTRGAAALREVLHRVGAGERFERALEAATGYTVASLGKAWRRSLGPWWGWWLLRMVFSPSWLLLWAALLAVVAFILVKRRRRRQAEGLDSYL